MTDFLDCEHYTNYQNKRIEQFRNVCDDTQITRHPT